MQLTEKEAVHNYYALKELLMRDGDYFVGNHLSKLETDLVILEEAVKSFKNGDYTAYKTNVVLNTFALLFEHFEKLSGDSISLSQGENSHYGLILKLHKDVTNNLFSPANRISISYYNAEKPDIRKSTLISAIYDECIRLEFSPPENFIALVDAVEEIFFRLALKCAPASRD